MEDRPRGLSALPAVTPAGDVAAFWRARLEQVLHDTYRGLPLLKFPEDLRVYEHLIEEQQPACVVEVGTHGGGSALWFLDRLRTLTRHRRPRVVTFDLDVEWASEGLRAAGVKLGRDVVVLAGDVTDPATADRVAEHVPRGARCLVVEDSAHTYETTAAALRHFHRFVPEDGVFVVEDGVVDEEELRPGADWPRGVRRAVDEFLASPAGAGFRVDRSAEAYGLTCHVGGYLRRTG